MDRQAAATSQCKPEWNVSESPLEAPDHALLQAVSSKSAFPAEFFESVMLNLIYNPNITSTYLFRADISYDSDKDISFDPTRQGETSSYVKHLYEAHRPRNLQLSGYRLQRTLVRNLIPRNPQLDKSLLQTCHFLVHEQDATDTLVVYIPHVESSEDMPFYHPQVRTLVFQYTQQDPASPQTSTETASLVLHAELFASNGAVEDQLEQSTRLSRTLLKLLCVIHKHCMGRVRGYQKRVHHDQVISQKRFQDTYTRLKGKYAKDLVNNWQEVTDPAKHVFEDLGIAAFLIELWHDMYTAGGAPFPGFIDIGCGNGILTYVLTMEGYEGSGFDARRRKSWDSFPEHVRVRLDEAVLMPHLLDHSSRESRSEPVLKFHSGKFETGTFVISNHADELTAWTPLLSCISRSPFLAIPCCSHNLAGERFRAPVKPMLDAKKGHFSAESKQGDSSAADEDPREGLGGKTGSLKQPSKKGMPSQYATLCAYVANLALRVGYSPEREILRIPSTRNTAVLGRAGACMRETCTESECERQATNVLEEEMAALHRSAEDCAQAWLARASRLVTSKGTSH